MKTAGSIVKNRLFALAKRAMYLVEQVPKIPEPRGARHFRLAELYALNWLFRVVETIDFEVLAAQVETVRMCEEELFAEVTERVKKYLEKSNG